MTVSLISPKWAPFANRTKVIFISVKMVSPLDKNTYWSGYFQHWADLQGFWPCNLEALQQPLFLRVWVARSKARKPPFLPFRFWSTSRTRNDCISDKPKMGSFCQSDKGHFQLSENGVLARLKYGLKRVFSTLGWFAAFFTLQFRGLSEVPFLGGMDSTVKWKETPFFAISFLIH